MKLLLKILGYSIGLIVAVVVLTLFAARFADGPLELIAGGPFTSGEPASSEPESWSFVKDYVTVEFALEDPARSRTTWIMEHNNRIFIPCGYMDTTWGRIWKQWPIQAEKDGRAILRVDGKLYDRQLVRIKQDPDLDVVLSEIGRKYFGGGAAMSESLEAARDSVTNDSLWIFELIPRP